MPILFCPQLGRNLNVTPDQTVMDQLLRADIPVASSCNGDGICGKCRILVEDLSLLAPPEPLEQKTLEKNKIPQTERLSCQIYPQADLTVKTHYW